VLPIATLTFDKLLGLNQDLALLQQRGTELALKRMVPRREVERVLIWFIERVALAR
jgi:hypothetical protein